MALAPGGSITQVFPDGSKAVGTSADGVSWAWQVWRSPAGAFPPGYQPGAAGAFPNAQVMN